jgi:head-tail adaptor
MIEAVAGATFTAVAEDADPGLVGTIGVAIEDADNNVISARTTDGIVESAPGIYVKDDLVAPSSTGTYLVIWDDGTDYASEELVVLATPGVDTEPPGMDGGGLLSTGEIAAMRRTLEGSLPDLAVVQTPFFGDDGGGGGTTAWSIAGTVACRVAPITRQAGTEGEIADRLAPDANWILTLPATTSIDTDDRIMVGARIFNVLGIHAPRSYEVSRRVEANEVA